MADHQPPANPNPSRTRPTSKKKPPSSARKRWTPRTFATIGILTALGLVSLAAVVSLGYRTTSLPDPNAEFETATSFVYYNDGKSKLGNFAVQNRQPLTYEEMPESMKQAAVAAENRSFFTDAGISPRGMIRSAWAILRGENLQGGSTITQQYIKVLYLNSDRTLTRKFKELFLAYKMGNQLSKEEVLEGYLNTIYFGRGAYGIQAASRSYFNIDAPDLTVPQSAVLAAVVNNPSLFDPSADPANEARLLERYQYVIQSMSETGAITASEASTYAQSLPEFPEIPINDRYGGPSGFLLNMVENELGQAGFDSSQINGGGLKIITTFDKKAQKAAVKAAKTNMRKAANAADQKTSGLHAAIASVEVGTGEVLALFGGRDFVANSRNWATTPRPTASTFKAYALAAGLDDGYSLRSRFNGNTFTPPGETSEVRNEFSIQYGSEVDLVKATADSINTAFVDLASSMDDGPTKIADMAEEAGAPKGPGWDLNARIPLGTAEVSPLAQAGAFATFANDGTYVANHVVREVRDSEDQVIWKANPETRRAMSADISRDVTFALSNVVEQGTGQTVRTLNRPVAGKTGTKDVDDAITSAWFVAYTKQISTAVMYVAGESGSDDLDKYKRPGDSTFFGSTYPALTWAQYMEAASEGMPVEEFDPPAYVNKDGAPAPTHTRSAPTREPNKSTEPSETSPSSTQSSPPPSSTPTDAPTARATETSQPTHSTGTPTASAPPSKKPSASNAPAAKPKKPPAQAGQGNG